MREIKFRAWIPETKDFIYFGLGENNFDSYSVDGEKFTIEDVREYEIMQYTGLKDKNGVEIYEGDILAKAYLKGTKYLIEYRDGCPYATAYICGERFESNHYSSPLFMSNIDNEVVGNIYENPELLK